MSDIERAIDAYRDAEPRRSRDPFADRALRDRLASIGASREARRGLRGWIVSWLSAVPGRAMVSATLSLALVGYGLSGIAVDVAGGPPNGTLTELGDMSAVKSADMVQGSLPTVTVPGGGPTQPIPATESAVAEWGGATLLVGIGLVGVIGSLIRAEFVRRRRQS